MQVVDTIGSTKQEQTNGFGTYPAIVPVEQTNVNLLEGQTEEEEEIGKKRPATENEGNITMAAMRQSDE